MMDLDNIVVYLGRFTPLFRNPSEAYEIAKSGNVAYVICIKTIYYFCTFIETR